MAKPSLIWRHQEALLKADTAVGCRRTAAAIIIAEIRNETELKAIAPLNPMNAIKVPAVALAAKLKLLKAIDENEFAVMSVSKVSVGDEG